MDAQSLTILGQPPAGLVRRERRWRIAIVALVVALYAAGLSSQWWIAPDSGLYLNIARNLVRGQGYTIAGRAHVHVPPGFPCFLAGMMSLGLGSFTAINAAMTAMGLVTVLAAYLLLRELVDCRWAMLLAAAFALSREMVERSGQVLTDVPFTLLVVSAMWLYYRGLRADRPERSGWEIASALLVASCWVRSAGFPLAVGAAVGLVLSGWRDARARAVFNAVVAMVGLAASGAFFYWYVRTHGSAETTSYLGSLARVSSRYSGLGWLAAPARQVYVASGEVSRLFTAQKMPLPAAMVLLVLPVGAAIVRRIARRDFLGPLTAAFYVGGVCLAASVPRTRYFLPVFPLLILYLLEGWAWGVSAVARGRPAVKGVLACVLMVVIVAMNAPLIVRSLIEKYSPDYAANQQGGQYLASAKVVEYLRQHRPPAGANVLAEQPVAYLADVGSPTVSRAMEESTPAPSELAEYLASWRIAYAVVQVGRGSPALHKALADYLERFGPPVFTFDDLWVFRVEEAALLPLTQPSPPAGWPQTIGWLHASREDE